MFVETLHITHFQVGITFSCILMDSLRQTVDFFFKGVNSVVCEADPKESFSVCFNLGVLIL